MSSLSSRCHLYSILERSPRSLRSWKLNGESKDRLALQESKISLPESRILPDAESRVEALFIHQIVNMGLLAFFSSAIACLSRNSATISLYGRKCIIISRCESEWNRLHVLVQLPRIVLVAYLNRRTPKWCSKTQWDNQDISSEYLANLVEEGSQAPANDIITVSKFRYYLLIADKDHILIQIIVHDFRSFPGSL